MRIHAFKSALVAGGSRQAYTPPMNDRRIVSIYDAPQSGLGFLQSQTAHIEREINKVMYPDIQYPGLIPVDTSAPEWATTVTYYSMDKTGAAKWISGLGQDIPNAEVNSEQFNTPVYMAAIGYGWSIQEIGQAQMAGIALGTEKASAARRAYEEFVDNIALNGDATKNFLGLVNNTAITPANVPADGTGSSRLFTAKTADQVLRDLNEPLTDMFTVSKQVEIADTLLLPATTYGYLASTPRSSTSDTTIMEYFRQNNIYTAMTGQQLTIRILRGLETAGASATKRTIAYRRNPEVLKLHIPMPHRFLAPVTTNNIYFEVPGIFRLGGLDIRRPGAVRYRDGF